MHRHDSQAAQPNSRDLRLPTERIDAAYRTKYAGSNYPASMLAAGPQAATVEITPHTGRAGPVEYGLGRPGRCLVAYPVTTAWKLRMGRLG